MATDGVETDTAALGTVVFLASDLMLFAGFLSAYYFLRTQSAPWPPPGVELSTAPTAVATVALVASSATLQAGTRAIERGQARTGLGWIAATLVLGAGFLAHQLLDYATVGFGISAHAYGSVYWTLTGVHGLHVVAGLILIGLAAIQVSSRSTDRGLMVPATYFWHLVDVVWLVVFATIWLVR